MTLKMMSVHATFKLPGAYQNEIRAKKPKTNEARKGPISFYSNSGASFWPPNWFKAIYLFQLMQKTIACVYEQKMETRCNKKDT